MIHSTKTTTASGMHGSSCFGDLEVLSSSKEKKGKEGRKNTQMPDPAEIIGATVIRLLVTIEIERPSGSKCVCQKSVTGPLC